MAQDPITLKNCAVSAGTSGRFIMGIVARSVWYLDVSAKRLRYPLGLEDPIAGGSDLNVKPRRSPRRVFLVKPASL